MKYYLVTTCQRNLHSGRVSWDTTVIDRDPMDYFVWLTEEVEKVAEAIWESPVLVNVFEITPGQYVRLKAIYT